MERIIDADKLYDDLADKLKWLMGYGDDVYLSVGDDIRCAIANQPTAYDTDKVVEQLETMRMRYYCTYANTGNKTNDDVCEKISRTFGVTIEIMKGGRIE